MDLLRVIARGDSDKDGGIFVKVLNGVYGISGEEKFGVLQAHDNIMELVDCAFFSEFLELFASPIGLGKVRGPRDDE
eukprot:scaffold132807_cov18-Tisochrysis_lutea.AAC.1